MKLLASFVLILALTACGFSPMYGSSKNVTGLDTKEGLDRVQIESIRDQNGVYLRNLLIDSFYQNGYPSDPLYVLRIRDLQEEVSDLDITSDSEATRRQIRLSTTLELVEQSSGKAVLKRELYALTSYNVLGSQFSTRVSESDAREAALNDLARQIETQIALYLNR